MSWRGAQGIVFFAHFEHAPKFPGFQSGLFMRVISKFAAAITVAFNYSLLNAHRQSSIFKQLFYLFFWDFFYFC